ncbi:heterokaryon incompatibility domain-containing protein [Trichoderma austrokoningii]
MGSVTKSPYKLLGASSFRLLKVWRKDNGDIAGHLETFSLTSQDYPEFATVSYAWGEVTRNKTIDLDGEPFAVLDSTYPILEAICGNSNLKSYARFWIDSICINSDDEEERASQVQLMGRLYESSHITIVWLGPGDADSDQAMEFFLTLCQRRDELVEAWEKRQLREMPSDLDMPEKWRVLRDLLQRPWWRRVWTIQEFILPSRLVFFCGTKHMSHSQFPKAMSGLSSCNPDESLIDSNTRNAAWSRRRLRQWSERQRSEQQGPVEMSLIALVAYTGDCFVTNPKDRIYGLLGLANKEDRSVVGQPIYRSDVSAETVYANVVRSFIKTYNSLDIICFATLFSCSNQLPEQNKAVVTTPSWVPNWNIRVQVFVTPLLVSQSGISHIGNFRPILDKPDIEDPSLYAAAGNTLPDCSISDDFRMTCKGIILDRIDGLGTTSVMPNGGHPDQHGPGLVPSRSDVNRYIERPTSEHDSARRKEESSRLLDKLIRSMVLDRQDRYLSIPTPLDRFKVEFAHLMASRDKTSAYKPFHTWINDNEGLEIWGFRLKELFQSVSPATVPPNFDLSEQREDGLPSRLNDTTGPREMRKRLMVTEQGFVGMAPSQAKRGDVVCVLYGCRVPVLLRCEGDVYRFVGECYIDGFMNGEIFERDLESTTLVLV